MAIGLPKYNSSQMGGAPTQALPNARVSVDSSLESFGGGQSLDRVNSAVQGVGQQVIRIQEEEKKKADDVAILEADLKASKLQTEIEIQVKNMRGKDAAGGIDYADKEWKKRSEELMGSLSNDDQRAQFQRVTAARYSTINKT
ncbi:MAG: hypothetical protein H0X02_04585, partial [Nitrosomonas sp.]|nr:hypothetical protein [Nitrosomonas sp.]